MTQAVSKSFAAFLERLVPDTEASKRSAAHRLVIEEALREHAGAARWVTAGSARTGTGIKDHSVNDVLVVLPADRIQPGSAAVLRWFVGVVAAALPRIEIVPEGSAVVVPFGPGKADRHRLIPARSLEFGQDSDEIFAIPDGSGGWIRTSPGLQGRYLDSQDRRAEAAARPLIRFVKAWKHFNEVPISSFYLELAATAYVTRQPNVLYTQALSEILHGLWEQQLAPLSDPARVSGSVQPFRHVFHRVAALGALERAVVQIEKARNAAKANRITHAIAAWNRLYNGGFPD